MLYGENVGTPIRETWTVMSVFFYVTHRWESDDRSLKAPSGISDMSLPWRDLRRGKWKESGQKIVWMLEVWTVSCLYNVRQCRPVLCGDRYSQQTQRLEPVERPHWYAPQAVVAEDSLHTEQACWHGDKCRNPFQKIGKYSKVIQSTLLCPTEPSSRANRHVTYPCSSSFMGSHESEYPCVTSWQVNKI